MFKIEGYNPEEEAKTLQQTDQLFHEALQGLSWRNVRKSTPRLAQRTWHEWGHAGASRIGKAKRNFL